MSSQSNNFFYCQQNNQLAKINTETFESEILYNTKEAVIQVNKDDTVAFIREKDKLTQISKICAIDLVKKRKIDEVIIETSHPFCFRVSPDYKFLIITIDELKIIKIDIQNP